MRKLVIDVNLFSVNIVVKEDILNKYLNNMDKTMDNNFFKSYNNLDLLSQGGQKSALFSFSPRTTKKSGFIRIMPGQKWTKRNFWKKC